MDKRKEKEEIREGRNSHCSPMTIRTDNFWSLRRNANLTTSTWWGILNDSIVVIPTSSKISKTYTSGKMAKSANQYWSLQCTCVCTLKTQEVTWLSHTTECVTPRSEGMLISIHTQHVTVPNIQCMGSLNFTPTLLPTRWSIHNSVHILFIQAGCFRFPEQVF